MIGLPEPSRGLGGLLRSTPPFVGRKGTLDWFDHCIQGAMAGIPRVILLQAEAGVGKTRLLKEVRVQAAQCGMQVGMGRCYEDLVQPYLPFVEALSPQWAQIVEVMGETLGGEVDQMRQFLYPDYTANLPVHSRVTLQSDPGPHPLFRLISQVAIALAQRTPLLIVVDDLHWADPLSLDLFSHLFFTLADGMEPEALPLLLIAAYRPVEPEARLARLITRFQREELCQTLDLDGLDESEMYALIQSLGIERPSHQLVATVGEVTKGNSLFIQEVIHHLMQQQALQERGGYVVTTSSAAGLRLPDEVTGAISSRFRDLSETCRKLLTLAAVVGERFRYETLEALSGLSEDELFSALEEGLQQRLLLSSGSWFQFAHPLIQNAFYHEPSAMRRQRMHALIAQTLESLYDAQLDQHVLEIAHHLIRASGTVDTRKVAHYGKRAGDVSVALFAWGDAARYYEAALAAADHLDGVEQAELHYLAGLAYYRDHDVGPCLDHYEKAIQAYQLAQDVHGLAHVLMADMRARYTLASVPLGTLIDMNPLEEILEALGGSEPDLRGQIAAVMAEAYRTARQADKAEVMATQAISIGRAVQDDRLSAYASFVLAQTQTAGMRLEEALTSWQDALAFARKGGDDVVQGWALQRMPLLLILQGRLDDANAMALEAGELTRTTLDWGGYSVALSALATIALARGEFEAVERYARDAMVMVERSRYPWGGSRSLQALACARALRGAWSESERALDMLIEPGRVFAEPGVVTQAFVESFRQFLHLQAGTGEGAIEPCADALLKVGLADSYALAPFCTLVEMSKFGPRPELAGQSCQALTRFVTQGVCFSTGWVYLLPRVLGVGAALQGQDEQAETYFQRAIALATQSQAQPELGRTYLDYARLLATRRDVANRQLAAIYVRQARAIFNKLGMTPFEDQATQAENGLRKPLELEPQSHCELSPLGAQEAEVLLDMARAHTQFLG